MGFIAIIVSSLACFLLSSSHLTIYGISVLGILYISMLEAYYTRSQICYIVAISGVAILPFWQMIHSIGAIFHCLPGRIHASMVFGTVLIVLTKVNFKKILVFPSSYIEHQILLPQFQCLPINQSSHYHQPHVLRIQHSHPCIDYRIHCSHDHFKRKAQ
jgi:hypothetical protein